MKTGLFTLISAVLVTGAILATAACDRPAENPFSGDKFPAISQPKKDDLSPGKVPATPVDSTKQ